MERENGMISGVFVVKDGDRYKVYAAVKYEQPVAMTAIYSPLAGDLKDAYRDAASWIDYARAQRLKLERLLKEGIVLDSGEKAKLEARIIYKMECYYGCYYYPDTLIRAKVNGELVAEVELSRVLVKRGDVEREIRTLASGRFSASSATEVPA